MTKVKILYHYLVFILLVCSCSIEVNPAQENSTSPPIEKIPARASTSIFPATHVPVTWADSNLSGKLVYLSSSMEKNVLIASVQLLDLSTGNISVIFRASPGAWIYYVAISPDRQQLVMSYEPAPQPDSASNRMLYSMPLDASASPQALLTPPTSDDHYTQVEWSPDGKYLYYVHYNHETQEQGQFYETYEIFRMSYPNGKPEKIIDRAFWPRVSADSSKLAYVSLDPVSGLNELFIANANGSNSQKVHFSGSWIPDIIDAPIFSPDGQSILFSAAGPSQSYQPNWVDKLMGIQVAKAHSIPSDWWSVPITGGLPTRLTNLQTINLFASLLPDSRRIVSVSADGVFVMNLDGSNLTELISDSGIHGTVRWIP